MAGCATPTSFAGHAHASTQTDPELTSRPEHPTGADHAEIASAALDMIVDHAAAIMRDVYAAIQLTDQGAITRGRAIMAEAFVDHFDELAAQAGAVGQGT